MNGDYAGHPYPATALATSLNYALAAQEMLRLMGDMSGLHQNFHGELILLNNESSAPRAHLDFPPHWHLEHWEDDYNTEYGLEWRRKQYIIPHFYLDSAGNVISNKQSVHRNYQPLPLPKQEREFGSGDTCTWRDVEGNTILRTVIQKDGLHFIKPDGEVWALKPDKKGAATAVCVWRGAAPIAKVSAHDDGEKGTTRMQIESWGNGAKTGEWTDAFMHDPFTGRPL